VRYAWDEAKKTNENGRKQFKRKYTIAPKYEIANKCTIAENFLLREGDIKILPCIRAW
jgi:hypothetical protein